MLKWKILSINKNSQVSKEIAPFKKNSNRTFLRNQSFLLTRIFFHEGDLFFNWISCITRCSKDENILKSQLKKSLFFWKSVKKNHEIWLLTQTRYYSYKMALIVNQPCSNLVWKINPLESFKSLCLILILVFSLLSSLTSLGILEFCILYWKSCVIECQLSWQGPLT